MSPLLARERHTALGRECVADGAGVVVAELDRTSSFARARRVLPRASDETVILLTLSRAVAIDKPAKARGGCSRMTELSSSTASAARGCGGCRR